MAGFFILLWYYITNLMHELHELKSYDITQIVVFRRIILPLLWRGLG